MHTIAWFLVAGFLLALFFAVLAWTGIAVLRGLFWLLLLPLKLLAGLLGAILWLVFLPLKVFLLLIMGILGLLAIPLVASVLCLFGLLWIAC
jgi:hypothetical protein